MENFTFESRYLKLCNEFRTIIRFMKVAFYRPDYQKLLIYSLIKRFARAFISKHAAELLKHSAEVLRIYEETKSLAESLKNSAVCLYYNTAHAVQISHGIKHIAI